MNNIVILLTGTINPNTFATLALTDPEIRREQYIEAIKYYLSTTTLKIVFVENSGCSIENEFNNYKDNKRLEFLTYKSEPTIPDKGKGAKELEIINYAINQSKFISNSVAIIKITGRLKVLNVNNLYSDYLSFTTKYKKIMVCNIYKSTRMDSRCFFFTKDFWSYLESFGESICLKYSIEEALWDSGLVYTKNGMIFKQFKRPLRINGVSGGFGTSYDDSFIIALVKRIRHYFRVPYYYLRMKNNY